MKLNASGSHLLDMSKLSASQYENGIPDKDFYHWEGTLATSHKNCLFCHHPLLIKKPYTDLIHNALYSKHCYTHNYYYSRDISDIIANNLTPSVIHYKEIILSTAIMQEYLKRSYCIANGEIREKLRVLTKYYKFHKDLPRFFHLPISKALLRYNMGRRRAEFKLISDVIREELTKENKLEQLATMQLHDQKPIEIIELSKNKEIGERLLRALEDSRFRFHSSSLSIYESFLDQLSVGTESEEGSRSVTAKSGQIQGSLVVNARSRTQSEFGTFSIWDGQPGQPSKQFGELEVPRSQQARGRQQHQGTEDKTKLKKKDMAQLRLHLPKMVASNHDKIGLNNDKNEEEPLQHREVINIPTPASSRRGEDELRRILHPQDVVNMNHNHHHQPTKGNTRRTLPTVNYGLSDVHRGQGDDVIPTLLPSNEHYNDLKLAIQRDFLRDKATNKKPSIVSLEQPLQSGHPHLPASGVPKYNPILPGRQSSKIMNNIGSTTQEPEEPKKRMEGEGIMAMVNIYSNAMKRTSMGRYDNHSKSKGKQRSSGTALGETDFPSPRGDTLSSKTPNQIQNSEPPGQFQGHLASLKAKQSAKLRQQQQAAAGQRQHTAENHQMSKVKSSKNLVQEQVNKHLKNLFETKSKSLSPMPRPFEHLKAPSHLPRNGSGAGPVGLNDVQTEFGNFEYGMNRLTMKRNSQFERPQKHAADVRNLLSPTLHREQKGHLPRSNSSQGNFLVNNFLESRGNPQIKVEAAPDPLIPQPMSTKQIRTLTQEDHVGPTRSKSSFRSTLGNFLSNTVTKYLEVGGRRLSNKRGHSLKSHDQIASETLLSAPRPSFKNNSRMEYPTNNLATEPGPQGITQGKLTVPSKVVGSLGNRRIGPSRSGISLNKDTRISSNKISERKQSSTLKQPQQNPRVTGRVSSTSKIGVSSMARNLSETGQEGGLAVQNNFPRTKRSLSNIKSNATMNSQGLMAAGSTLNIKHKYTLSDINNGDFGRGISPQPPRVGGIRNVPHVAGLLPEHQQRNRKMMEHSDK